MKKYKWIAHAAKIRLPSREMRSLHMADAEQIIGYCPKCGKELQIPGELPRFACMYCATKLTQAQLLADAPAPMPAVEGDAAEEFAVFSALVLACVTNFPDSYKKVTRSEFSKYSDTYLDACRPVFDHLDRCARIEPDRRTEWAELGAEDLMQQLNDWFAAQKGWNSRARQARIVDNAKFTIALFLVPMLSRGNWTISRPFAKHLHTLWMARYPKSPFTLASYDDLVSGFRKRWLCFITTAVCEAEGKPDDCAELTAFRRFRDGWLSQQPDGPALIEEYYEIAPAIVLHLQYADDAPARYAALRRDYLSPCYAALQAGDPGRCKQLYTQMVRRLERQYLQ